MNVENNVDLQIEGSLLLMSDDLEAAVIVVPMLDPSLSYESFGFDDEGSFLIREDGERVSVVCDQVLVDEIFPSTDIWVKEVNLSQEGQEREYSVKNLCQESTLSPR